MNAPAKRNKTPPTTPGRIVSGIGIFVAWLAYWAPLLLALGFFTHVAYKALAPALHEQRELEREHKKMQAHEAQQLQAQQALELELEALEDPIYQERVRRAALIIDSESAKNASSSPDSGETVNQ